MPTIKIARPLVALVVLCLLPCLSRRAQGQEAMTLERCIAYALEHSPRLERLRSQTASARAERLMAIGALLPQVAASTSLYASSGRGIDPKTNTYTTVSSLRNNYSLEASMVLFDGLAGVHRLRQRRLEERIALSNEQAERRKLRMEVVQVYYKTLLARQLSLQAERELATATALLKKVRRMHELGMNSATDVAEVSAQQSSAQHLLTHRSGAYRLLQLELMALMHYPSDSLLEIAPAEAPPTLLPPSLIDPQELYRAALGWLPELQSAQEAVRAARLARHVAVGAFVPRLSLGAGYSTSFSRYMDGSPYEPFADQLRNRAGQYIGLTLSVDLFAGFRHLGTLRQRRAALRSAIATEQELETQIQRDIEATVLELRNAIEQYQSMRSLLEHRSSVYQGVLRGFETGRNTALELTQAINQRTQAEAQLLEAYTTYLLHKAWAEHYTSLEPTLVPEGTARP